MYSREIEGEEFTFGVSGKLIRNVLVMYDRQTESLWSQLLGESIEGEMIGARLEFVPSWFTTWAEWKEMFPDTVALDKGGQRGDRDVYDSYFASPSAGVIGETFNDPRLDTKAFIIGVPGDAGNGVAYPFGVLESQPVINDTVDGQPLAVVFDPATDNGVVFSRVVDDQVLTFSLNGAGALVDAETQSEWDAFTGIALAGPLAGSILDRVTSTRSFWFGWKDFYPNTEVYEANTAN